jgi:YidC/Oxa1 family membrane protein insertase
MNLLPVRITLLFCMGLILTILMVKWDTKYPPSLPSNTTSIENTLQAPSFLEEKPEQQRTALEIPEQTSLVKSEQSTQQVAELRNELVQMKVNTQNGEVIQVKLAQIKQSLDNPSPFELLYDSASGARYIAQTGVIGQGIPAMIPFQIKSQGSNEIVLTWQSEQGIDVVKTYRNNGKDYRIEVDTQVQNNTDQALSLQFYEQLLRTEEDKQKSFLTAVTTYTGAVISTPEAHYSKVKLDEIAASNLDLKATGGWAAMLQHYFVTAWVPSQSESVNYYSRFYQNRYYGIGYVSQTKALPAGQALTDQQTLYAGPAVKEQLKMTAPYLDLAIDYGWLWFISDIIFTVMQWLHLFISNWGLNIIAVTCLIKFLFYPLSAKSYRSMAKMRQLQPKIEQLKARTGDDKQKFSQEMMALYRDEKVNPLGGCLPILIQIPVFIALYWVLMESIQLRHAPFYGWIHDLSAMDPYYVLPVLMGGSMFLQQRLSPAPPDPTQAKVMMFMPVIFTVMFLNFPSGLVLYWLVNNCLSILQQWWVNRQIRLAPVVKKKNTKA